MTTIIDEKILKITNDIEEIVYMLDIDYIDACIMYCELHNIEIEYIGEILKKNQALKSKLQFEAEQLNFIKKSNRLPI
jgi:hypothetical protein